MTEKLHVAPYGVRPVPDEDHHACVYQVHNIDTGHNIGAPFTEKPEAFTLARHLNDEWRTRYRSQDAAWLAEENERLQAALAKINEIRNRIVGLVTVNWAALHEAGFEGMSYPKAREYFGTLLERTNQAEARIAELVAELEESRYVPGELRCPECGFRLSKRCLRAADGAVGVDASTAIEFCPNDSAEMQRLSWRQADEESGKTIEALLERIEELKQSVM